MIDYKKTIEYLRHADDLTADHKLLGVCARAAAAIEDLQAEVEELKAKKMKLAENSLRFVGKVRELDKRRLEPKRGEVVRCGECKHGRQGYGVPNGRVLCAKPFMGDTVAGAMHDDDWYCADGEREVQE